MLIFNKYIRGNDDKKRKYVIGSITVICFLIFNYLLPDYHVYKSIEPSHLQIADGICAYQQKDIFYDMCLTEGESTENLEIIFEERMMLFKNEELMNIVFNYLKDKYHFQDIRYYKAIEYYSNKDYLVVGKDKSLLWVQLTDHTNVLQVLEYYFN